MNRAKNSRTSRRQAGSFTAQPVSAHRATALGILAALCTCLLLFVAAPASAALVHPYQSELTEANGAPLGDPCGVNVDAATQDLNVIDPANDAVDIFDSSGAYQSMVSGAGTEGAFAGPYACSTAVDDANGNLYVADSGPDAVDVFGPSGNFLSTMNGSNTPEGSFGLSYIYVATDPSNGDIYVSDSAATAAGGGGVIDEFSSSGVYLSQLKSPQLQPTFSPWPIAVDSSGDVYFTSGDVANRPIVKFNSAGEQIGELTGSETPPGSFGGVSGLAIDSAGNLYVADVGNKAIDEFNSSGTYLGRTTGADTPAGSSFSPAGVASGASGRLYVADPGVSAVEILGPAVNILTATTGKASELTSSSATLNGTVDPEGEEVKTCVFEWGQGQGEAYEHTAPCEGPDATELGSGTTTVSVHADIAGLTPGTAYHFRLVASSEKGTEQGGDRTFSLLPAVTISALAPTGILPTAATLRAHLNPNGNGEITACQFEYVTEAAFLETGYSNLESGGAVSCQPPVPYSGQKAVSAEIIDLAGANSATTYHYRVIATDAGGTTTGADQTFTTTAVPRFGQPSATSVSYTEATLHTPLSPEGLPTSFHFEYLTEAQFEDGGFANPAAHRTPEVPLGLDAVQTVTVDAAGGQFRLNFEGEATADIAFDASASVLQEALRSLTAIGSNGVSVEGGPGNSAGSNPYVVTFEGQLAELAVSRLDVEEGATPLDGSAQVSITAVGSDHTFHPASAQIAGLQPGTVYHYRLIASNSQSLAGGTIAPESIFHTYANFPIAAGCPNEAFRTGPSAALPDCRAYEMVTAAPDGDAEVYVPASLSSEGQHAGGIPTQFPFQVSPAGDAVAYIGDAGLQGGSGEGGAGLGDQHLATRGAGGGWSLANVQPNGRFSTYYQGFSADLSTGIFASGSEYEPDALPLSPGAPGEGYRVLYAETGGGSGAETYRPLFREPLALDRSPEEFRSDLDREGEGAQDPVFAGGSADSEDLLFEADDALLPAEAPLAGELGAAVRQEIAHHESHNYLYDSVAGRLSLIDVSPQGTVLPDSTFGALPVGNRQQVEPDFSDTISADGRYVYWTDLADGRIYLRLNPTQPQSEVEGGECTEAGKACTLAVSAGSAPASFWTAGPSGRYAFYTQEGRLFRYDAQEAEAEALTVSGAQVQGVLGAAEDGSSAYFVAEGVLTHGPDASGQEPIEGQPNLYRWSKGGSTVFIATLAAGDGSEENPFWGRSLGIAGASDGGFGDWQPSLGHRTARVTGDGTGLVFMSSRALPVVGYPQGYPTSGNTEVYLYQAASGKLFCASCSPSGEPGTEGYLPISWSNTYLPQWVSEDGDRVFFDSGSGLSPADHNSAQDVYEWEREGSGGCAAAEAVDGGCTFLLSAATSPYDSWLIGASADGSDVFIVTRAPLSAEDGNEKMDIYDARVGAEPATAAVICEGREECQHSEPAPPPYTTPPTASFHGPGNPGEKKCKKGLVAEHGKCLKKPRKHHKAKHKHHKKKDKKKDKNKRAGRDGGGAK